MKIALVWFRRDFRLHDNAALRAALDACDSVIPVYLHAPEEEATSGDDWRPGGASRWWLHHTLRALQSELREHGSDLVIRNTLGKTADSLAELRALIRETGASEIHWNRLYEPHAVDRDMRIKQALNEAGVTAVSHAGCLLHEPSLVRTKTGNPFQVFTPFWKTIQSQVEPGNPLPKPEAFNAVPVWPRSLRVDELSLIPDIAWYRGIEQRWQPGEAGAHNALREFLEEGLADYAQGRDLPARDFTSQLSPHLHWGEISPRQVWTAVENMTRERPSLEQHAQKFLAEIGWREFAHHVLFNFPHTVNESMYAKYAAFPWRDAEGEAAEDLRAWQRGETGYPIVDAGMRQLWRDGWMHNRVRMVVASFLVKNLRIHWLHGAKWFWDTLVDADLASNTLGWQWAAGSGADAAPYFRIFNPMLQSEKFQAEEYIREYVPALKHMPDKHIHAPWEAPLSTLEEAGVVLGRNYPEPIVDYRESRERALAALQELKNRGNS